ncbi:MAG: nicotinamide phosphoribosyltransferase domain-containing protein [Bacteroidales bacterium]|jgi:nicotinamide phosphoribosyltransferase|nr:nicotinamide phosphoribosyltransferase domain-containing protein [Bacteroidales bacterium]
MSTSDISTNIIFRTDSYKLGHWRQYLPNTEYVYSYFESRNGAKFNSTVFFGLQYLLKEYLQGTVVTREAIEEAERLSLAHLGVGRFNRAGWQYILDKHQGRLPVEIRAVAEGTPVPVSNVQMTVENTDPNDKCSTLCITIFRE